MKIRKSCPICGNENPNEFKTIIYKDFLLGTRGEYDYVQKILTCKKCCFAWSEEVVDEDVLDDYYKKMNKYESASALKDDTIHQKGFLRQKVFIDSEIRDYESVLEIGAATGENLSNYATSKKVLGVDPSAQNCIFAKEKWGIDIFSGTLDEYYASSPKEKYDIVFSSHVLEHLVDFKDEMKKMIELSNRYIFVEVPTIDGKGACLEPYGHFQYEHVNYFSIEAMHRLMAVLGCRPVDGCISLNEGDGAYPLYPSYMSLWEIDTEYKRHKGMSYHCDIDSLLEEYEGLCEIEMGKVRERISKIPDDIRIAVWGTGAHTARLLSMTALEKKNIVKFYDSDLKKKGMTMIGKPISPFRPEDIGQDVDEILISSYYSENSIFEYAKKLKPDVKVIKLYS